MVSTAASFSQRQLKQAIEWFVRLQAETCGADEQARFNAWLAKHESHADAYREAERIWQGTDQLKQIALPGLEDARAAKANPWRSGTSVLTVLLILGALLTGGYLEYSAETQYFATRMGERRSIELADHSQLQLNTQTEVTVRISLLKRQVILSKGEVMFTVHHESFRPFSVQANNLEIRDIGTRFNVNMQADGLSLAVLEGAVELNDGGSVKHHALGAGQQLVYKTNSGVEQAKAIETEQVTAWQQGQLVFKHTPLKAVVAELERYHPVHFVLADAKLAEETLSGTFDSGDLQPFLHALQNILPVRAKQTGQQIVLRRAR